MMCKLCGYQSWCSEVSSSFTMNLANHIEPTCWRNCLSPSSVRAVRYRAFTDLSKVNNTKWKSPASWHQMLWSTCDKATPGQSQDVLARGNHMIQRVAKGPCKLMKGQKEARWRVRWVSGLWRDRGKVRTSDGSSCSRTWVFKKKWYWGPVHAEVSTRCLEEQFWKIVNGMFVPERSSEAFQSTWPDLTISHQFWKQWYCLGPLLNRNVWLISMC